MIIHDGLSDFTIASDTAISVGKFDGLHLGHREIIEEMVRAAHKEGLVSAVLAIYTPGMPRILTREEMAGILKETGVDIFLTVPFTEAFRNTEAETFLQRDLLDTLHMKAGFSGRDFRFGKGGRGDVSYLLEMAGEKGYRFTVLKDFCLLGQTVRSSLIREQLSMMDVERANAMLGRPYSVSGTVTHGKRLGSAIGYPTVNIIPGKDKFLPGFGVYAAELNVLDEEGRPENDRPYRGILDLGVKPTVQGNGEAALEVHLFDFDGDLYGRRVRVSFLGAVREEKRFSSLEALRKQIAKDVKNVQTMFKD